MFGGITFNKKAEQTFATNIAEFAEPEVVTVPLIYHKEQKNSVIVKAGDKVNVGTLLSKAESVNAVNIFSPVSGRVAGIIENFNEEGETLPFVVIQNDKLNTREQLVPIKAIDQVNIIKRMSDAGLIDQQTKKPCHLKYLSQVDRKIDNLVIDCVENEPYINSKLAVLEHFLDKVVMGAGFMALAADVKNIYFVLSQNDTRYVSMLKEKLSILEKWGIDCRFCSRNYPSANYKLIMQTVTKIVLKENETPSTFGTIIETPHSCLALYEAVSENKPFYESIVSVYGTDSKIKGNIKIKNGTSLAFLFNELYGVEDDTSTESQTEEVKTNVERLKKTAFTDTKKEIRQVVLNSLLSGLSVASFDLSLGVYTRAVIFLNQTESKSGEEMPCIYCNKCAYVCPMRLMPMWIDKALASDNTNTAVEMGAKTCISCGCCSYVCPSRRQILQRIEILKKALKETQNG